MISDRAEFRQRLALTIQNEPKVALPVSPVGVTRVHRAQLAYFQKAAQMLVMSQNHVLRDASLDSRGVRPLKEHEAGKRTGDQNRGKRAKHSAAEPAVDQ
jgi:hypothetical protein